MKMTCRYIFPIQFKIYILCFAWKYQSDSWIRLILFLLQQDKVFRLHLWSPAWRFEPERNRFLSSCQRQKLRIVLKCWVFGDYYYLGLLHNMGIYIQNTSLGPGNPLTGIDIYICPIGLTSNTRTKI